MDAEAKALAVRRRKSLLQYLKRNGLEPPTPTRTTTWAPVGVISVGTPSARPVARVLGSFFATSTTKHFVHTRPEEEMVTDEAWDDADADDTVSDRRWHLERFGKGPRGSAWVDRRRLPRAQTMSCCVRGEYNARARSAARQGANAASAARTGGYTHSDIGGRGSWVFFSALRTAA